MKITEQTNLNTAPYLSNKGDHRWVRSLTSDSITQTYPATPGEQGAGRAAPSRRFGN